jgi:FkbM family methyltransferase
MKFSGPINVLDIGANNGGFSLMLKAQGLKVKKVVCVELNPNTFSRLRFNIERNLDCDLFCLNAAINGDGRDLTVRLETGSAGDSIYRESSTGKLYEINGITFDGIYESCFPDEVIDLCKIDVEGAEFEVFSGAQSNQIRNVKYLLIEIHHNDSYNRQTLIDKLIDAGFEERQGEDKTHPNSHYVHFFVNKEL